MRIQVDRRVFVKVIDSLRKYVTRKQKGETRFTTVKFFMKQESLHLAFLNNYTGIYYQRQTNAQIEGELAPFFVDIDALTNLPFDGDILFIVYTDGKLTLECDGRTYTPNSDMYRLDDWLSPFDPMILPDMLDTVGARQLADMLKFVGASVATEQMRPILTYVHYLRTAYELKIVGADGFRLSVAETRQPVKSLPNTVLIPFKPLQPLLSALHKFGGAVSIYRVKEGHLALAFGSHYLMLPEGEGKFPEVVSLIDKHHPFVATLPRRKLQSILSTVTAFNSYQSKIEINKGTLSAGGDTGSVTIPQAIQWRLATSGKTPPDLKVALNSTYLLQTVAALPTAYVGEVKLTMRVENTPFNLEAEYDGIGYFAVVMPMSTR